VGHTFVQLIVIVQLFNSTSSAVASQQQPYTSRKTRRHSYTI